MFIREVIAFDLLHIINNIIIFLLTCVLPIEQTNITL